MAIKSEVPKSGCTMTKPMGNIIIIREVKIVYIEFTFSNFILWKYLLDKEL